VDLLRRALAAAAACALACAGADRPYPPLPTGTDDGAAREVLSRFARALEAGRFDEAHALLSARWRAAYTRGRLALDWRGAGPAARDAAARVIARVEARAPLERSAGAVRLPVAAGRAARLVAEVDGWRVDALE
jgi:hypothetical protein